MNLFHINSQPDLTDTSVIGQKQQDRLQRINDQAREEALAKHVSERDENMLIAIAAQQKGISFQEMKKRFDEEEKRMQENRHSRILAARKSAQAKMAAAARIQVSPINPEIPYVAMKWEPKPNATVALEASDGSKVVVNKNKLERLLGA